MKDNKLLAWTSFTFFVLSVGAILLFVLFATLLADTIENPGIIILVIGVFSLLAAIMGFLAFKFPQAKVGGIGGLVLLLLFLFIIPVGRKSSITVPPLEVDTQGQNTRTRIADIDIVIDAVLEGNPGETLQLLQFSTLACTHADGLGGPPKCREGEEEGTKLEVFPFLGPEGHHVRKGEMSDWAGIQASGVYAVYRVSPQAFSDEAYPAGEYAIAFLDANEQAFVTVAQITDGKIVRIDQRFGNLTEIDLERDASEFILAP